MNITDIFRVRANAPKMEIYCSYIYKCGIGHVMLCSWTQIHSWDAIYAVCIERGKSEIDQSVSLRWTYSSKLRYIRQEGR